MSIPKHKLQFSILTAIIIAITVLTSTVQIYASNQTDTGINDSSSTKIDSSDTTTWLESIAYNISDNYAKQLARNSFGSRGDDIVAHMKKRVTGLGYKSDLNFTAPTTQKSSSWTGYETYYSQAGGIPAVAGEFNVVPSVNADDSVWSGIGGDAIPGYWYTGTAGSGYLIQSGATMFLFTPQGEPTGYWAWYELFPAPGQAVFQVNLGDTVISEENYDSNTGKWDILIIDYSTDQYWSQEFSFSPEQDTAEWIIEPNGGGTSDVGTFNKINLSSCWWEDNTFTVQHINSDSDTVFYVDSNSTVTISTVGSDGESFSMAAPGNYPGTWSYPASEIGN